MVPPVERSITVSAPYLMETASFASSSSTTLVTALLPMFAFTLQESAMPMPMGSRFTCATFAGITNRPRATSSRTTSAETFSRRATKSISSVTTPRRA